MNMLMQLQAISACDKQGQLSGTAVIQHGHARQVRAKQVLHIQARQRLLKTL